MQSFRIKTENNEFDIEYFYKFISKKNIGVKKDFFSDMCKEGCKNYGKKYSCPPLTPDFKILIGNKDGLYVVLFKTELNQVDSTEYNKIRIANVVMKSKIIKLMILLESKFNTIFLSTGSCNLCKPCQLKLNLPCKHPDKRRYCLESLGVDCNKLCKDLFDMNLLWYKNKKAPKYTCVICGLVCDKADADKIEKELNKILI